jgi:hypothetical protein
MRAHPSSFTRLGQLLFALTLGLAAARCGDGSGACLNTGDYGNCYNDAVEEKCLSDIDPEWKFYPGETCHDRGYTERCDEKYGNNCYLRP